ncbi:hypothetical protein QQX98_007237 [Neonectria punicea]|uniref:Protein kinase domain-containing protein n=1 Tax=Neonectria punicea TaxID=979145 RepID=A0ABR1GZT9_9HYPO
MVPRLIEEGKIQILGQTANSVDSNTGFAKDSPSVLKGGTVWYEGRQALGPGKDIAESDERLRKEASIYQIIGQHDCILRYHGLETSVLDSPSSASEAWAVRLERSPYGSLRDCIMDGSANPPPQLTRLSLACQFSKGVAYLHQSGIIWGDLSTRNAFLFDEWRVKLGGFAGSDTLDIYPSDWYGCEVSYCLPGSDRPQRHTIGTVNRELFALGSAIYEILEWKVPYGSRTEISADDVIKELFKGAWPKLSDDNTAKAITQKLWIYSYGSSGEVADDFQNLLLSYEQLPSLKNRSQHSWSRYPATCAVSRSQFSEVNVVLG